MGRSCSPRSFAKIRPSHLVETRYLFETAGMQLCWNAQPVWRKTVKSLRGPLGTIFILLSCILSASAADHGIMIRVAHIYLNPDETSTRIADITRGREVAILDRTPNWLHVLASITPERDVTGWILDKGAGANHFCGARRVHSHRRWQRRRNHSRFRFNNAWPIRSLKRSTNSPMKSGEPSYKRLDSLASNDTDTSGILVE